MRGWLGGDEFNMSIQVDSGHNNNKVCTYIGIEPALGENADLLDRSLTALTSANRFFFTDATLL